MMPLHGDSVDTRKIISNTRKLRFGTAGTAATQVGSGMAFPVADLIQTFKQCPVQALRMRVEADAGMGRAGEDHLLLVYRGVSAAEGLLFCGLERPWAEAEKAANQTGRAEEQADRELGRLLQKQNH